MIEEVVHAHGHENVSAEHTSTFEVTSDDYLTPAGDCILAIEADRTPADFDDGFVAACQQSDSTIVATIEVEEHTETIEGRGHPDLTFENDRSLVGRTSEYVDDRTVMVDADSPALGIGREMVETLAAGADLRLRLSVNLADSP
jgi:hypothetical protein